MLSEILSEKTPARNKLGGKAVPRMLKRPDVSKLGSTLLRPWCRRGWGVLNPGREKYITGKHRRRGSNSPLVCDPGWVV